MRPLLVVVGLTAVMGLWPIPAQAADADLVVPMGLAGPVLPITQEEPFTVVVDTDRIPDQISLTMTVYPAVKDLTAIGDIDIDADPLGRLELVPAAPVLDDNGHVQLQVPTVRDPDDDGLWVPAPGVYPVEVSMSGDGVDQRLVTSLIDLGRPGSVSPLRVAPVVTVGTALVLDDSGNPGVDADGLDELADSLSSLAALGNLPATVVVSPASIDLLSQRAPETVRRLAALLTDRQVVSPPYVPIDLVSYAARGDGRELSSQLAAGNAALGELIEGRLDTQSFVADTQLDAAAVDLLAGARINQLVVDERNLVDDPGAVLAFGHLVDLDDVDGGPRAVVTVDHLVSGPMQAFDPPEATTAVWARIALLLQTSDPRAVHGVVLTEAGLGGAGFVEAVTYLDAAPSIVQPVTLDALFDQIDTDPSPRRFEPTEPTDIADQVGTLAAARLHAAAISTMLPDDDDRPARFDRDLLTAADRRFGLVERTRIINSVRSATGEIEQCLGLPLDDVVSLFDRSATLPLSFDNTCDVPLTVLVALQSDRLTFPTASTKLVLAPGEATLWEPEIRARTPGRVSLSLQLFTPSPSPVAVATATEITVNVRTNSGLGVVITVVAGGLLAGWWVLHLRRRWHEHRGAAADPAT